MTGAKSWKIYTRSGDLGETSLIGGKRVLKCHPRIECYGTLDELNSLMGMLRDLPETAAFRSFLIKIQHCLFTAESQLALEPSSTRGHKELPELKKKDLTDLEKAIDQMSEGLPVLKQFILPGGHVAVSWAHLARTVCRRAERLVTALSQEEEVDPLILQYLNRLSDYLFVLSRRLSMQLKVQEVPWELPVKKNNKKSH